MRMIFNSILVILNGVKNPFFVYAEEEILPPYSRLDDRYYNLP